MHVRPWFLAAVAVPLVLAACGDSGATVSTASAGSSVGSASGSGSGSGSGSLAEEDLSGTSDDALVQQGVSDYAAYVREEIDALIVDASVFTDAVRAGDVAAAKAAYAPSRVRWERIEPIAGLVEEIDGAVDARVDAFDGVDDPRFTGWHRIEHLLWEAGDPAAAEPFADRLDADIATLADEVAALEVPPAAVALGAGELVEEVSKGKITGEEDRYSHTDLWDFAANIEGAERVVETFAPVLERQDAAYLAEARAGIDTVQESLEPYRRGRGWAPYTELTDADRRRLTAQLGALAETLSRLPSALDLA